LRLEVIEAVEWFREWLRAAETLVRGVRLSVVIWGAAGKVPGCGGGGVSNWGMPVVDLVGEELGEGWAAWEEVVGVAKLGAAPTVGRTGVYGPWSFVVVVIAGGAKESAGDLVGEVAFAAVGLMGLFSWICMGGMVYCCGL